MDKKPIQAERDIDRVFEDFVKSLRSHTSEDITYHTSHLQAKNDSLGGQELFSKFTADIIKEEVVFTR